MQLLVNERPFPFSQSTFPGGEIHVRLQEPLPTGAPVIIAARLHASADIMALLMLTDAVRRAGATDITLRIPYLPYARQDRVCNAGEALSARVMCELINAQSYDSVEVWDIHSDVGAALLDRVRIVQVVDLLERAPLNFSRIVMVAPDAGAMKRVACAAKRFGTPMVRADKSRDTATGAITGTLVYSDAIGDRDFLIVDDICDGGRTFVELAKVLRPLTDGKILLYVTHGIFSNGTAVFDGVIDEVYVANSFVADLPSNIRLI
jgi:ribose-phosphate pyrophosphokinase